MVGARECHSPFPALHAMYRSILFIAWLLSLSLPWYAGGPSSSSAHMVTPFLYFRSAFTVTRTSFIQFFHTLYLSSIIPFVHSRRIPQPLVHAYLDSFPTLLPALALPSSHPFSAFLPPLSLTDYSSSSTHIPPFEHAQRSDGVEGISVICALPPPSVRGCSTIPSRPLVDGTCNLRVDKFTDKDAIVFLL